MSHLSIKRQTDEEGECRLSPRFPFPPIGHHTERTITCKDFHFALVCSALRPFQLRVAIWNSCHVPCLPNEATSVGGWAGGVSICLKSQCIFYLMIFFYAKTYIFAKQLQNPFVSNKVKKKKCSSSWQ